MHFLNRYQHDVWGGKMMLLAVEPGSAGIARAAIRDELPEDMAPAVVTQAELLTSELVSNAVRHAGMSAGDTLELNVDLTPELLRVGLLDDGPGFEKDVRSRDEQGGWGLLLVETVSDRWGVNRGERTEVWFEIDL
jgi:anti-sigma regulatory factor (Ser/Thr protein kinase)